MKREPEDLQTKVKLCVVTTIIAIVIVGVWGIPINMIVIFYLPESYDSLVNFKQVLESTCSPEIYNGEACRAILQNYQGCLISSYNSSEIYIPSNRDQLQLEQQASQLMTGLQNLNPSQECEEVAMPFLCFYFFGLCDSSGQVWLPSSEQCEIISSETCAREIETVTTLFGSFLQCESLPINSVECAINGSGNIPETTESNSSSDEIICQVDFFLDNRTCKPKCGEWGINTKQVETALRALDITATIIGIIGGIIALVLSLLRYKRMFKFPSAFIVYQTAGVVLLLVVILIGHFNKQLYCSSDDLIVSYTNGSPYCAILGTVNGYFVIQSALWWIFYILALFWGIRFPFHYRSVESSGKLKYVHLLAVVVGVLLPCITIGISNGTRDYTWDGIPPVLCSPVDETVRFYSHLFPVSAVAIIGLTLMLLVLWILIKERLTRKHKNRAVGVNKKVLVIVIYFILIGVYGAITLSITYRHWPAQKLLQELTTYFLCESTGLRSDRTCDRSEINTYAIPQTSIKVSYFLAAMLPVVTIIFAWNTHELKRKWMNTEIARYFPYYDKQYTLDARQFNTIELEQVRDQTNVGKFTSYVD